MPYEYWQSRAAVFIHLIVTLTTETYASLAEMGKSCILLSLEKRRPKIQKTNELENLRHIGTERQCEGSKIEMAWTYQIGRG